MVRKTEGMREKEREEEQAYPIINESQTLRSQIAHALFILCFSQVWQKASVICHHGFTNSHSFDSGHLCQFGHVLYPQLSERTWPSIILHHVTRSG